jgi:hypothetical protein
LTVPVSVAPDWLTPVASLVVTAGGLEAAEAGVGVPADEIATASTPQATSTIAAATRILRMLPPFVSVQYFT